MWLACVHFNRLFYSDSNDVRIVWGLWGLFSQVVNLPLLCSTFSSESLAYLLCSPAFAHSRLSTVTQSPRLRDVCMWFVWCVHTCMCAVCMHVSFMCFMYVCVCASCPIGKSSEAEKSHRRILPECYLLTQLHRL